MDQHALRPALSLARTPLTRRAVVALGASLLLTAALGREASAALPPPRPAPGSPGAPSQRADDFVWPAGGPITTRFGEVGPYSPRGHQGIDVGAPMGSPVVAAAGGKVTLAGDRGDGYGTQVLIQHPGGLQTRYGHLSRLLVGIGDQVAAGQRVGLVGSTGYSTGPHLHFEVIQDGGLRDPLGFLP